MWRKTLLMTRLIDACYRGVFRVVYPLATLWWRLYGNTGIFVAVWVGDCACHRVACGQARITVWRPSANCMKKSV
jgi:hypothetical protein